MMNFTVIGIYAERTKTSFWSQVCYSKDLADAGVLPLLSFDLLGTAPRYGSHKTLSEVEVLL